jgi:hypothetical protein
MWQLLAGAGLKGVGSYLGGRSAEKAAYAAANAQAGQAGENAALSRELPYRLNPYLAQSAEQWSGNVRDQAGQSGFDLINTAGQGANDVNAMAMQGAGNVNTAAQRGAQGATDAAQQANQYLDPYMQYGGQAGQQMLDYASGGGYKPTEWNTPDKFTAADLETDPGYQFRLAEGNKALQAQAAAKGILQSGGTLKALTRYGQDAASQEYANAWDRAMKGRQQDFTEWTGTNRLGLDASTQRMNTLGGLAGYGANAAARAGGNLTDAAQYGGTLTTGAEQFGAGLTSNAAQFGANMNTGASRQAGDWANRGAEYQSNMMNNSTQQQIASILAGENQGMNYLTDRAAALAGGQVGAGNARSNMWGGMFGAAGDAFTLGGLMGQKPAASPTNKLATGGYMQNYYPNIPWGL